MAQLSVEPAALEFSYTGTLDHRGATNWDKHILQNQQRSVWRQNLEKVSRWFTVSLDPDYGHILNIASLKTLAAWLVCLTHSL